ncbi:hypothetical protein PCE1_004884 [Barthelona sp. PCE]
MSFNSLTQTKNEETDAPLPVDTLRRCVGKRICVVGDNFTYEGTLECFDDKLNIILTNVSMEELVLGSKMKCELTEKVFLSHKHISYCYILEETGNVEPLSENTDSDTFLSE